MSDFGWGLQDIIDNADAYARRFEYKGDRYEPAVEEEEQD